MRTVLLFLCLSIACSKPPAPPPNEATPPPVDEQAAERELVRDVDLPMLRTADRAVLTYRTGEIVERKGADVGKLVAALTVTDAQPSAGVNMATIAFYRGTELLREVWVFAYGEWGLKRNGITSGTLGLSHELAKLIKQ